MDIISDLSITRAPIKALKGHELFLSEVKMHVKQSEKEIRDEIDQKLTVTEIVGI